MQDEVFCVSVISCYENCERNLSGMMSLRAEPNFFNFGLVSSIIPLVSVRLLHCSPFSVMNA